MTRRPVRASLALVATTWVVLGAGPARAQPTAPDDPLFAEQQVLVDLALPDAWATSTGEGVRIAVLDSGVDPAHPDLADHLVAGGAEQDPTGTGTHAAGVAAAVTGNAEGIAGAAPDAEVLALDVLDEDGTLDAEGLATGIAAAADAGAGVIALTLGGRPENLALLGEDEVLESARTAIEAGVVVVAGTDGGDGLPTDLPLLLVGDGSTEVDPRVVTVPADGVLGPAADGRGGYEARDGLGPATALVAGTAALLVAQARTPDEVTGLLIGTAQNPDGNPRSGAGRIDAAAAIQQAASTAAGGGGLPTSPDTEGGLPPWGIGAIAVGAAGLTIGLTLLLAGRGPRRPA